ncbi:uncharacterized protein LOC128167145 [Crassostrea angulata]|uniref:Uncharacterized protein n=1 Tax=Magallana gigas TaxID=29159 RepID=A0A8W8KLN7_MAGGI|nr:uncharacterized protein LOC105342007 isoform X1 [Crassostrea gigas]XP_052688653.1 uncharacterized protein LOC128167145 [Crassostrea angulata]
MADSKSTEVDAIYYDVSPYIIILLRMFNFIVLLMAVVSLVICIVQGKENNTYYLLAANTGISGIVCLVVNWWYKSGDLGPEKYWYIFLVGTVILFQCITTDIFVYRVLPPPEPTNAPYHPSVRPRNFTINWFSLLEASTKPHFGLDDITTAPSR